MPNFGKETIGVTYDTIENKIQGTIFTCPENGYALSLTAYLADVLSGFRVKAAIYRASDLSLVATTEEIVGWQAPSWFTFNVIGQPLLIAGEAYLLVCWSNAGVQFFRDAIPSLIGRGANVTYGDFPTSLAGLTWDMTVEYSIYCTYFLIPLPPKHTLAIGSTPIQGIPFTIGRS